MPNPGPCIEEIRAWFPTLNDNFAYLENAGGSQAPGVVVEAMHDYMLSSYVQLGAGYAQSQRATKVVDDAHSFMESFVNADGVGRVVLGPSTTALTNILANAYGETIRPGDEIVIAETNHEANAGPWARLERFGAKVRIWHVNPTTFECSIAELEEMLNDRTRIVALPHVSNLLGHVVDLKAVVQAAHRVGARVVADGVAYAPHRSIDVRELGVDWYVFSTYKVYGPHMAALFGRGEAFEDITGPNHFFVPNDALPYKFELGGVSHEACAGLLAVGQYLAFLAGNSLPDRSCIVKAFEVMEKLEFPLQTRLVDYLRGKAGVRIIGPGRADATCVGTVSFYVDRVSSDAVTAHTDTKGIGIRHGHMYAYRLCQALGIPTEPGVVRVSLLHYNTMDEIDRLITALDEVL